MKEDMKKGFVHETKFNGSVEIVKYHSWDSVLVRFIDTGHESTFRSSDIRNGNAKDYFRPSVMGIGFIGVGNYTSKSHKGRSYKLWLGMFTRCYSDSYHKRFPTYKEYTVHPDWHNFQNFAKWYEDNHPSDGERYHLDKDIKIKGNKVYSPTSCQFSTVEDNVRAANSRSYTVVSPSGVVTDVFSMRDFCIKNNLAQQNMSKVVNGERNSCKGWTLYKA